MAKKAQIGDVMEIPTKKGLAYAQFSHYHEAPPRFGALMRILPGLFQERPKEFGPIVAQKESFYTFFPLQAAVNRGIFKIIAHEEIPLHARKFPLFRSGDINSQTGRVDQWWLWDGIKSWKIDRLTDEQLDLPIKQFPNDLALVEWIEEGWTPRHEEAFRQAVRMRSQIKKNLSIKKGIRHFLLFKNKNMAEQGQQLVDKTGFKSEIIDHGSGFTVAVRQGEPLTEEYVEHVTVQLTEIGRKSGGTYDAWETEL